MTTNNVLVNNLCSWPLSFKRITGQGDFYIPANAKNYPTLTDDEVRAQIQSGNVMFVGTDGMGGHARLQIVDDGKRRELFGLEDGPAPTTLTEETVRELLAIKTKTGFNARLRELVKTDAEKRMLVELAFKAGADNAENWKVEGLRTLAATTRV